jgi:hypothetical protein
MNGQLNFARTFLISGNAFENALPNSSLVTLPAVNTNAGDPDSTAW